MVKYRDNVPPTNRTEQYILNKYIPSRMADPEIGWFDAKTWDYYLIPIVRVHMVDDVIPYLVYWPE